MTGAGRAKNNNQDDRRHPLCRYRLSIKRLGAASPWSLTRSAHVRLS
jgi:hypothetical protein